MKRKTFFAFLLMGLILMGWPLTTGATIDYLAGCKHLSNSTIRIEGEKVVYFDPYEISEERHDGDLVLITHPHWDHFHIPSIRNLLKEDGIIAVTPTGVDYLKEAGFTKFVVVEPDQHYQLAGVNIKTVRAYNPDKYNHPKHVGYVGYIVELNGYQYYFAGDTGSIPEMAEIQADVAFLPVDGRYTMTAAEAADAAKVIKPAVAVPIHFGFVAGSHLDAERFISLLPPEIQGVVLLEDYQTVSGKTQ